VEAQPARSQHRVSVQKLETVLEAFFIWSEIVRERNLGVTTDDSRPFAHVPPFRHAARNVRIVGGECLGDGGRGTSEQKNGSFRGR
jgi:hypothetical protein